MTQAEPEPEDGASVLAGRLVARARSQVGISQRELARRSGVPGPVVNAIERSRRQPSVPTLAKLLRGMDLDVQLVAVKTARPAKIGHATSSRAISRTELARAREVRAALDLANRITRAKASEARRGIR